MKEKNENEESALSSCSKVGPQYMYNVWIINFT